MMNKITTVRFAKEEELEQTNALRKQVYDLHAQGKSLVFGRKNWAKYQHINISI